MPISLVICVIFLTFYGPDVPALDVNAWAMAKELFAEYS